MLRASLALALAACAGGLAWRPASVEPETVTVLAGAPEGVFEPLVVVREREVVVGHRSDCARAPGEGTLSEPCASLSDRWFAVARLECDGRCQPHEIDAMGLSAWLTEARRGFPRSAPLTLVSSGVVPAPVLDAVRATVAKDPAGGPLYPDPQLGGDADVWWATR